MRVLVVIAGFRGWALDRLYSPLQSNDIDVRLMHDGINDSEWSRYDIIHFTYYGLYYEQLGHRNVDPSKCIVTIHHIPGDSQTRIVDGLASYPPAMFTTGSPTYYTPLALSGVRTAITPYWVGEQPRALSRLRTVGIMGQEQAVKRFSAIRQACRIGNYELIERVREPDDYSVPMESLDSFYNNISCYVSASYCEGGPMPMLDAWARSIPVVATPVGAAPFYMHEGINGYYTDGTPSDIARKVKMAFKLPQFVPPPIPSFDSWKRKHLELYGEVYVG